MSSRSTLTTPPSTLHPSPSTLALHSPSAQVNPRIQGENTVTEVITGIDLVQSQIRVAAGQKLADVGASLSPEEHISHTKLNSNREKGKIHSNQKPPSPPHRADAGPHLEAWLRDPGARHHRGPAAGPPYCIVPLD